MSSKGSSGGIEEGTESDPDLLSNPYASSSSEAASKTASHSQDLAPSVSKVESIEEEEEEDEENSDGEADDDDEAAESEGDGSEPPGSAEDDDAEEAEEEDEFDEGGESEEEEIEEESEEDIEEGDDLDIAVEEAPDEPQQQKAVQQQTASAELSEESTDSSISSRSNEKSVDSEFEVHELDREAAMVFLDPPWANKRDQVKQLAVSCSLPCLLVVLLLYSIYKFLQIGSQCLFDCFTVVLKCILLLIKLIIAPFAFIWIMCMPTYIQKYVSSSYERHIGRRIRICLRVQKLILLCFLDIPHIIVSCALSCVDTCVTPARLGCASCSWHYMGSYIFDRMMYPLHKHDVNRRSAKRRKFIEDSRKDHDLRAQRHKNQKKARRRKKEQAERAKKIRDKKRLQQFEVKLNIPQGELDDHGQDLNAVNVQMADKKPTDRITRTMIIERRYAVAVGMFWTIAGLTMFILILDGQKGERCEICVHNENLGLQVCRHGIGQDCSFKLHQYELIVALGVITMGNIVMIYSIFLYQPHGGSEKAAQKEEEERQHQKILKKGTARAEDPDNAAVHVIQIGLREPTVPRVLHRIYRHSPCHVLVHICSACANAPLRAFYKWETKRKLRIRSMNATERFTALVKKLDEDPEAALEEQGLKAANKEKEWIKPDLKRARGSKAGLRPDAKREESWQALLCKPAMCCLECVVNRLAKTTFGLRIAGCIAVCFPSLIGWYKDHQRSKEVMEEQGPGSRGSGPSTMEDILNRFGLNIEEEEPEDVAKAKALAMKEETVEEKAARLRAEKPDPLGHVETLRDAGGKDDIPDDRDLEPTLADLTETPPEDLANAGVEAEAESKGSRDDKDKTKERSGEDVGSNSQQDTNGSGSAEVIGSSSSHS